MVVADAGKFISFEITPVAGVAPTTGTPVESAVTVAIAVADIGAAGVTGLVAPVTGVTPIAVGALATAGAATSYTVTSITWNEALDGGGAFNATTVYTATVVLTSTAGYKFPDAGIGAPSVNAGAAGAGATVGAVSGNTLTFTVTFPITGA